MKTFKGPMMAAVLLVAAGFGIGVAQAAATNSERPVLGFESMEAYAWGGSSSSSGDRPVLSFEDQEGYRTAGAPALEMEAANPIETGRLPSEGSAAPSIIEAGGVQFRLGEDTGP